MKKDFVAAGMCFRLGNMHIVTCGVVLEEVDSFGQYAIPLGPMMSSNFCSREVWYALLIVASLARKSIIATPR